MSRGFKDVKKQGGKNEITRQNSYDYFIKTEKVPSIIEMKAKERFDSKPYSHGKLGEQSGNKNK